MLVYSELGRHTPPPPPYSESKRDTSRFKLGNESSQRQALPPPPPPYLSSMPKSDCRIPSINELRRQGVILNDSYSCDYGNAIPFPLAPPQRSAAQIFDPHQSFEGCSGSWEYDRSCPGVPAHPVEPKWTPAGVLGYPGPPLGVPFPKLSPETPSHSAPQGFVSSAGTRTSPGHESWVSQSPSTDFLGHIFPSCATRYPEHTRTTVTTMDQRPLQRSGKRSSKDVASFANITTDATGLFESSENICPLSALPCQRGIGKRATLTRAPASQRLDAVERVSHVKSLLNVNDDSSSNGDSSGENGESNRAAMVRKGHDYASLARFKHETRVSKDYAMSRGQESSHHVPNFSNRRPSASARFAPYKRRQSKAAERMEQDPGGE